MATTLAVFNLVQKGRSAKEKMKHPNLQIPNERYQWLINRKPTDKTHVAKGVVILVPIFNTSARCWNLFSRALTRLDPLPEKVIFLENNSIDDTLKLIWNFSLPHEVIRLWFRSGPVPESQRYDFIAQVRDMLLNRARRLNANLAIFLDDDVIPESPSFIQKFLDNNLPICGGAYSRQYVEGLYMACKWATDQPIEEFPCNPEMAKELLKEFGTTKDYITFAQVKELRLYKIGCMSGGALALSRKVLEDKRLSFYPIRHDLLRFDKVNSEDYGFCCLARSLGYPIYLDSRIQFAHQMNSPLKDRPWMVNKETGESYFSY